MQWGLPRRRIWALPDVTRDLLLEVVAKNDKRRFSLSEDGRRIRAVQGHSIEVDLAYPSRISATPDRAVLSSNDRTRTMMPGRGRQARPIKTVIAPRSMSRAKPALELRPVVLQRAVRASLDGFGRSRPRVRAAMFSTPRQPRHRHRGFRKIQNCGGVVRGVTCTRCTRRTNRFPSRRSESNRRGASSGHAAGAARREPARRRRR